jgi:hypothetical protein
MKWSARKKAKYSGCAKPPRTLIKASDTPSRVAVRMIKAADKTGAAAPRENRNTEAIFLQDGMVDNAAS